MSLKINENFNFFANNDDKSMIEYTSALKAYSTGLESAIKLENEIILFFDTNILLRTYSSSFEDRDKLKRFFINNKNRIYITNQVQKEFINNREGVIEEFYKNITSKIPENFRKEVINNVTNYYNSNKLILNDYTGINKKIEKINKELASIYEEIKRKIKISPQAKKDIKLVDDILDIYSNFNFIEKLDDDEISFLIKEFDERKKSFTNATFKSDICKIGVAFPGAGDILEKPDYPYGDFIIFHEILKYVKSNDVNVVFLTYDSTKNDWMDSTGEPHVHYIVNTFINTKRSIYILDAKRVLQGLLEISPTSLSEITEDETKRKYYIGEDKILFLKYLENEKILEQKGKFINWFLENKSELNTKYVLPKNDSVLAENIINFLTDDKAEKTIAEIFAEKENLDGLPVMVRGKVVKFSLEIMGNNWIHLQDGTGADGSNDLTIITKNTARPGDTVVVFGLVSANRDFGYGYKYPVLIEHATVITE